jgi:hypothetical protein
MWTALSLCSAGWWCSAAFTENGLNTLWYVYKYVYTPREREDIRRERNDERMLCCGECRQRGCMEREMGDERSVARKVEKKKD